MEDILDIYEMPYNPAVPVVCLGEKPYQLLGEFREPLPMRPGDTRKVDSEYVRNGTCSIFAFVEPLGGIRHVSVRAHRTAIDWADEIRYLVDVSFLTVIRSYLYIDKAVTIAEISDILTIPKRTVEREIKNLRESGKITRRGGRRYGYWEIM
ncbi:MAG: HTH domain-containing protein [Lachnospiraceae bacterium]|nr:HTH domain-containing protein [Lachnospiraceae bacterium]